MNDLSEIENELRKLRRGILTFIAAHRERLNAVFGAALRRAPAVDTLRALFLALDPAETRAAFADPV